jgi:peptide/nickel transport system substrate-binding protein
VNTSLAEAARGVLSRGGWKFVPAATSTTQADEGVWTKKTPKTASSAGGTLELSFTLATADEPELVATAHAVAAAWRAAGIEVAVQVYPLSELNTNIIRPRAYDAILFGEVVGRSADLFAFWHSSQRNDPGLNLAMYANSRADALLAQARATTDRKQREILYTKFTEEIRKDVPAVFLYAPEFIYVVPQSLRGIALGSLSTPAERFQNAYQWYTDTESVWSIFADKVTVN